MSPAEAGLVVFEGSAPESKTRRWNRYEEGKMPKQDIEGALLLTLAVNGNLPLTKAIFGIRPRPNKEGHPRNHTRGFGIGLHGIIKSKGKELLKGRKKQASARWYWKHDFIKNGRGVGTSLEHLIDLSGGDRGSDPDVKRNRIFENFFNDYIELPAEPHKKALQDFWLTLFQRGQEGREILDRLISIYGPAADDERTKDKCWFLNKYAVRFATDLLFELYAMREDPLDPNSSVRRASMPASEFDRLHYRIRLSSLPDLIKTLSVDRKKNFRLNFARSTYEYDTLSDPATFLLRAPEVAHSRFAAYAKEAIKALFDINNELVYRTGKMYPTTELFDSNDPLFQAEILEKHVLFRLYSICSAKEFLEYLWLMEETFAMYEIYFKELYPDLPIAYTVDYTDNFEDKKGGKQEDIGEDGFPEPQDEPTGVKPELTESMLAAG